MWYTEGTFFGALPDEKAGEAMNGWTRLLEGTGRLLKKADLVLLGLCLVLTVFGIVLIASATNYLEPDVQRRRLIIQGAAAAIGVAAYFIASNVDVEHYAEKWGLFLLFNLGFIALLIVLGRDDGTGNKSWIAIPGLTSIQPAEIVKLTYTVLLAKQLAWFRDERRMRGLGSMFWPAAHMALMFGWIFVISGDAGSGLVYLMIYAGMACAAGLAWYWFAAGAGVMALGITALALLDKIPAYMVERFKVIFDHSYDVMDKGWQQTRSLMAIGSGGLLGQGLFHGVQTQAAGRTNLPARHTDLIFAVCGEELGLVGCLLLLLLEFLVVYRCFQTARVAKTTMGSLICVGFATMLIFQTVENVGMCLFVMPVIGLTLPFVSYGGSSVVTLFAAMGVVSGVRARSLPDWLRKT